MRKTYKKGILILLVLTINVIFSMETAFGEDVQVITPEVVVAPSNSMIENPSPRFKLDLDLSDKVATYGRRATLESKYDLRDENDVTSVKNQGSYGTCWSFAACSSAESSMLKQGFASSADYSEAYLVNFFYNRQNDPLGNTAGDRQVILSDNSKWDQGGDDNQTLIALSGWTGMADESVAPYSKLPADVLSSAAYNNSAIIKNGYILPNDKTEIKEAVKEYGALTVAYYSDNPYYSINGMAYYCNDGEMPPNHEVSLIGWDDTYSKDNFTGVAKPKTDGAWIIKNSWGTGTHDNGVFYLSYEDATFTDIIAYEFQPSVTYDHNYYYDGNSIPVGLRCWNNDGTAKVANVYTAKGDSTSEKELIKAVGFISYTKSANYSIQIYKNPSTGNPESGTKMMDSPTTGMVEGAGFSTVKLGEAVSVAEGDTFAVVIDFSNASDDSPIIGVEAKETIPGYMDFQAGFAENQSFIYKGGQWEDLAANSLNENEKYCARIKAFTVDAEGLNVTLSKTSAIYNGQEQKPEILSVINGDRTLDSSEYDVSYIGDFKTAGTHRVKITEKGADGLIGIEEFTISKIAGTMSYATTAITKTYGNGAFTNSLTKNLDGSISYKSSNTSVAIVDSTGKVTIRGVGSATITATAAEGINYKGASASYKVTVKAPVLSATSAVSNRLYGYDDVYTSWKAVSGASGYKVYYKKSTSSSYSYKGSTTGTSMKLANLADGAKYYVRIIPYKTINGVKYNGYGRTSSGIYMLKKLGTPSISKKSYARITVKWSNIAGESGYQISKSTSKSKTGTIYTVKTTTGKTKVLSVKRGKTYYYKVRAYRTVGSKRIYGPWSKVKAYKLK